MLLLAAAGLLALTLLLCFSAYLRFCRFVVNKTGGTEGLRDVAVAMRAFAALPLPRSRSK